MWTLLLAVVVGAAPPEVEVQTLSGETLRGSIVKLDDQAVTIQAAGGPVSLEIDKLMALAPKDRPKTDSKPSVWVELVDGSQLVGRKYTVKDGRARLATSDGAIEVPTADVFTVRLQQQTDAIAPQWSEILEDTIAADLLVVRKGDSLDYHEGVLHDVSDQTVKFELDGDILPVKRAKVYGLIYRHPKGRQLPAARCVLTDAAGARWFVRSLALEGENIRWTTPTGLKASQPLRTIVRVDFSEGKVVFLSDLKPESVAWTPFFGTAEKFPALARFFAPRQDRALDPNPLKLNGKTYRKGVAIHSRTELVYRLPGRFRRFVATVGIDDAVRPQGNVQLIIRGDDRVLLDDKVTGADRAKPIELDVTGVRRLTILVDFGENLDLGDHLDLCEARVIK